MREASISATARHLDLSRERLRQLQAEGVIEPLPGGGFDIDATRIRYIRWLRDRPVRSSRHDELYAARTELARTRNKALMHELLPYDEVVEAITGMAGWFVSTLEGMPFAMARHDRPLRETLQAWVRRTREMLADRTERVADTLEKTGRSPDVWRV